MTKKVPRKLEKLRDSSYKDVFSNSGLERSTPEIKAPTY